MEIKSMKLTYFSPTGTTKTIIQHVASGINQGTLEEIDITKLDARNQQLEIFENELLVVAVPVYMGRVPDILNDWLTKIKAYNAPTVCIVVYGNRAYDDALLELKNILIERGCKIIAGAAYIGEHSFSSCETPIAQDRPNLSDLNHAELFGHKIAEKLLSTSSIDTASDVNVPGNYPYGGITKLWSVDFITINSACTNCGICASKCPVGAIDLKNINSIDKEKCITCCACIKGCPQNARTMKAGLVKDASIRLNKLHSEPKEPVFFL